MDIERACIAKILVEDELVAALEARLTPVFFAKDENKRAFQWMLDYWGKYGKPPTLDAFKVEYPTLRLPKTDEPIGFLVDKLREQRRKMMLQDVLLDVSESMHVEDPAGVQIARLSEFLIAVNAETSEAEDTDLITTWAPRLEAYRALRKQGGIKGITTGIPSLDKSFGGLKPEQLVTLIGEPKMGKSMLLLAMAHAAHEAGHVPMLISFEMSNAEQAARYDALSAHLDHQRITNGQLTWSEVQRLKKVGQRREGMHSYMLSADIGGATTVSGLRAKIEQYHPSVLYVDGMYLMDDELGSDRYVEPSTHLTNITRSLKRLAQQVKIPIVGTTQVLTWKVSRSRGLDANAIGYSSSFAQDSDLIIGIEAPLEDELLRRVKVILSRVSAPMATNIQWDWSTSTFSELGVNIGSDGEFHDFAMGTRGGGRAQGRV